MMYDELATILTEVEVIINLKPLSYFSSEDIEELLTPSHSLTGHHTLSLPDGQVIVDINGDKDFTINQQDINGRMSTLKQILAEFWDRWHNGYLLQLRERYLHTDSVKVPRAPVQGEIVLIHEDKCSLWRSHYRL